MPNLLLKEGANVLLTNGFIATITEMNREKGTITLVQVENGVEHVVPLIEVHKLIDMEA